MASRNEVAPGREMGSRCIAVRVRMLSRAITRVYDAALRPHGLTIAQLNLLVTVGNLQPAAAHEVADMLSLEISTLSRNARLAEQEGWLEVLPAERGNGRILQLTGAGQAKLSEVLPAWRTAQAQARDLLGRDGAHDVAQLVNDLWGKRLARSDRRATARATR